MISKYAQQTHKMVTGENTWCVKTTEYITQSGNTECTTIKNYRVCNTIKNYRVQSTIKNYRV